MRSRFFAALMLCSFSVAAQEPSHHVVAVSIDSVVHPITVEIVKHAIEQAQTEHAELLLIRLNTPGGLLDATRHLIQELSASHKSQNLRSTLPRFETTFEYERATSESVFEPTSKVEPHKLHA